MKHIVILTSLTIGFAIFLAACSDVNVNVNTNRLANQAGNAINKAGNMAGNAVNTVANTIANTQIPSVTTPSAEDFLKAAAQGGMAEVQLGNLAATKSQNAEIKAFGKLMAADHAKVNAEVKALAAKLKYTPPTDVGSHRSTIDDLTKAQANFDKDYVNAMVKDHEDDVAAFQKQADNATDADVKAFAAKTLPTLKSHLEKIKAIQAKMK